MSYAAHLATAYCVAALLALSANLVVGYCGMVSLAHAALFGVGAYAYGVAMVGWGFPIAVCVSLGILASTILAVMLGQAANRFKGDQFLLVSLVLQVLVFEIIRNSNESEAPLGSWANLTHGPYGIKGIAPLVDPRLLPGLALAFLGAAAALSWAILSTPFGRLLKAIRDDEWAVQSLGRNVQAARRQAFAVAGAIAALAGILYSVQMTYLDPSIATVDESVLILSMLIIGGSGNRLLGPLCGALVFVGLPEVLRLVNIPGWLHDVGARGVDASNLRLLAFGILLVLIVHLRPQGLAGSYRLQ